MVTSFLPIGKCYTIGTIKHRGARMAIEDLKQWVLEEFERKSGIKGVTAWPISANCWHVQAEDGELYMLRWMEG